MSEITRGAIGMPFEMAMESELSRRQFHSIAQALLAERDQLKAENEALVAAAQALRDEWRKDQADAERYRWLRVKQTFIWLIQDWFPRNNVLTDVDAEIDAAMSKGEQS